MKTPDAPRSARFAWRWLVDSPLVVATWVAVLMCLLALLQVARALRDADRVRARSGQVLARIAAEAAAARLAQTGEPALPTTVSIGRVPVRIETRGDEWLMTAGDGGDGSWQFRCPRLPGAAPRALGRPLTVVGPGSAACEGAPGFPADVAELPGLDPAALERAWRADQVPAFRRDVGIALLHLPAGTERDDFVLDPKLPHLGLANEVELVQVPGHLWIEPGRRPWRIRLERDLTLVVLGNLYVGRAIEVDGPGRLVFVTRPPPGAHAFVDRDGNGRWTAGEPTSDGTPFRGPAEGGGNVYLGLSPASGPLQVAAGLVAHGEVHLFVTTRVGGPVVLAHGATCLGSDEARLVPTGERLFEPEREAVPGFLARGTVRPGRLRALEPIRAAGEEPLYLAAPAR